MMRLLKHRWPFSLFFQKPRISAIAAVGAHRELGKDNQLLWRIPADLKRVKELTTGHPIIMGRKTYESIGRPLPNRTNIVVSKSVEEIPGCIVTKSLESALRKACTIENEEVFIFGGAQIYTEALPVTNRLYLTIINATDAGADVYFPDYSEFTKTLEESTSEENGLQYSWVTVEK